MAFPNMELLSLDPLDMKRYLEVADGVVRLKGHRIGIEHIVERFQEGWSAEQIALDFPGVSLEKIYAVITYYLHNTSMVQSYIDDLNAYATEAYQAWVSSEPSDASLRIRQLRAEQGCSL